MLFSFSRAEGLGTVHIRRVSEMSLSILKPSSTNFHVQLLFSVCGVWQIVNLLLLGTFGSI